MHQHTDPLRLHNTSTVLSKYFTLSGLKINTMLETFPKLKCSLSRDCNSVKS